MKTETASPARPPRPRLTRRSSAIGVLTVFLVGAAVLPVHDLPAPPPTKRFSYPMAAPGPDPGPAPPAPTPGSGAKAPALGPALQGVSALPEKLPGLGPGTAGKIPADSRQVVITSGAGRNSPDSTVTLYRRTHDGRWLRGPSWSAHNGLRGWSGGHRTGDLRSPVGVFTLSDAGGLGPDPGTRLPYHRSAGFSIAGTGFRGEDLAGTFDHVVAVDYNRVPGRSPLDPGRPLGPARGGGIWLHVDHGGPTHGCITLAEEDLVQLMRTLDPDEKPVIVMGDQRSLSR